MLIYLSIFICFLYITLILVFIIGWDKISIFVPTSTLTSIHTITVVVACKNEELHLPKLLSCLAQQSYQNFELILVNDHSTDNTLKIMKSVEGAFLNIKIIDSDGFGKKAALKEGIECAKGNLIVTTDGDCLPSFHWLETISSYYKKHPADLIICPVRLANSDSFYMGLQLFEFTSLVASGAAATGVGMPILCNGANLAFTKKAWLNSQADLRFDEQSGDDVFLLQSIKKRGGVVRFLKSESAFVVTKAASSISDFIKQRGRWAAKAPAYTDWQLIFTACIVLSISALLLSLTILALYDTTFLPLLTIAFSVKLLADTTFLYSIHNFFQLQNVWFYSILLSIVYPFYIVFVAVFALFFKPKIWK